MPPINRFAVQKPHDLTLVFFKPVQYDRQKSVIIFVPGKFCKMDAGTENWQLCFGYDHKIVMEVGVYFRQEIQSNGLS